MRKRFDKETHDGWYVFIAPSMRAIFVVALRNVIGIATWLLLQAGVNDFTRSIDSGKRLSLSARTGATH